jgi:RNA-directed DNA polymerase
MDDILILAPSRWKLRRAVATLNTVLTCLRLQKHPDKTFIGRIEKGFDFLGYHFVDGVLRAAQASRKTAIAVRVSEAC